MRISCIVLTVIIIAGFLVNQGSYGGTFQNPTVLSNGVVASGYIAPGGEEWFAFNVFAITSSYAIVSMETSLGSLPDTYMDLYEWVVSYGTTNLQLIESDDDGGIGFASKIERPLGHQDSPSRQRYLIKVRGYSSSQSGTFAICTKQYEGAGAVIIADGTRYTGNITAATACSWYKVYVMGGAPMVLETALGSCPDTYMYLYQVAASAPTPGRKYVLLASDDDSGEGYASRITTNLTDNGSASWRPHLVKIRAYSENQTGTFQIWGTSTFAPVMTALRRISPYNGTSTVTAIKLGILATNAPTHYMTSESPSFAGASWQAFDFTEPNLQPLVRDGVALCVLSPNNGPKTVYVKVKNACGESNVMSVPVTLQRAPEWPMDGQWRLITDTNRLAEFSFYVAQAGTYEICARGYNVKSSAPVTLNGGIYLYGPHERTLIAQSANFRGGSPQYTITQYLTPGVYYVTVDQIDRMPPSSGYYAYQMKGVRQ